METFSTKSSQFFGQNHLRCTSPRRPKQTLYKFNHWRVLKYPVGFLLQASHTNRLHTTTAVFITFEEVICPLPEHGVNNPQGSQTNLTHQAFSVTLQQDGLHSLEHLLVIFNSKCQNCAIQNKTFSCLKRVCIELHFDTCFG